MENNNKKVANANDQTAIKRATKHGIQAKFQMRTYKHDFFHFTQQEIHTHTNTCIIRLKETHTQSKKKKKSEVKMMKINFLEQKTPECINQMKIKGEKRWKGKEIVKNKQTVFLRLSTRDVRSFVVRFLPLHAIVFLEFFYVCLLSDLFQQHLLRRLRCNPTIRCTHIHNSWY